MIFYIPVGSSRHFSFTHRAMSRYFLFWPIKLIYHWTKHLNILNSPVSEWQTTRKWNYLIKLKSKSKFSIYRLSSVKRYIEIPTFFINKYHNFKTLVCIYFLYKLCFLSHGVKVFVFKYSSTYIYVYKQTPIVMYLIFRLFLKLSRSEDTTPTTYCLLGNYNNACIAYYI